MHNEHISALIGLLAMGMVLALLFRSRGWSTLIAYLTAGALAANFGLAHHNETVHGVAEIGAAMLLFSLGLEINVADMRKRLGALAIGAGTQIFLTLVVGAGLFILIGNDFGPSVAIGACITLSSTLMVFRALDERALR